MLPTAVTIMSASLSASLINPIAWFDWLLTSDVLYHVLLAVTIMCDISFIIVTLYTIFYLYSFICGRCQLQDCQAQYSTDHEWYNYVTCYLFAFVRLHLVL